MAALYFKNLQTFSCENYFVYIANCLVQCTEKVTCEGLVLALFNAE